jgi:hypothetical protein
VKRRVGYRNQARYPPTTYVTRSRRYRSAPGFRFRSWRMGHLPATTLGAYAHVIRELKGEPVMSAEQQIERARRELPGRQRHGG